MKKKPVAAPKKGAVKKSAASAGPKAARAKPAAKSAEPREPESLAEPPPPAPARAFVAPAPAPTAPPAPAPAPVASATPSSQTNLAGKKILLVDDDEVILAVYGETLSENGFDVVTASDGLSALERLKERKPELVILDMMMPKLTGVEVLRFIRAQPDLAPLPVAIFTNAFMDDLAQAAVEIGVQQTIIKAECAPSKLIALARDLLSGKFKTITPPAPAAPVVPDAPPQPLLQMEDFESSAKAHLEFKKEAPVIIAELRDLYQAFRKSPDSASRASRLDAFYRQVHFVTALSGLACYHYIALLSSVFEALLFELQQTPERITPSSLRTMAVTLDFLGDLFARVRDEVTDEPVVGQVLVVDDDAVTNRVAVFALQRAHLPARAMENPVNALKLASETHFDLVLLDIEMPEMSGFDFCKKLRAIPGYEKVPVIYVTVHTDFENRAKGILAGGSDLIAKPFFPIELAVKAVTHLVKSRLPGATTMAKPVA
jgi:CheY-like chemotaxis protein